MDRRRLLGAPACATWKAFPKTASEITSLRSDAAVSASVSDGEEGSTQLSVADLVIGETYTGVVKNVTSYGAFVDIGASKLGKHEFFLRTIVYLSTDRFAAYFADE